MMIIKNLLFGLFLMSSTFVKADYQLTTEEEDKKYISVSEVFFKSEESLNYLDKAKLRKVEISGKKIIIEENNPNGIFNSYQNALDIKELVIKAETIVIRESWNLPQTNISLYAEKIIFEDNPSNNKIALIDVTPRASHKVIPAKQFQDGLNGVNGGSIKIFSKEVKSSGGQKRFIANGGDGLAGGDGENGGNGNEMKVISQAPNGHQFVYNWFPDGSFIGTKDWPTDGADAKAGGNPGNAGNAGEIIIASDTYANLIRCDGGNGGPDTPAYTGGHGGKPSPAYWSFYSRNQPPTMHESQNGKNASGKTSGIKKGANCSPKITNQSWLTYEALEHTLNFLKDRYIEGNLNDVQISLEKYIEKINQNLESDDKNHQNLENIKLEMASLSVRIANHFDYFSHPAGWAPMLSFESNYQLFTNEIDSALEVLFVCDYITNAHKSLESKVEAIAFLKNKVQAENQTLVEKFTKLNKLMPGLVEEAKEIERNVNFVNTELTAIEQEIEQRAERTVEDRNKVPEWKRAVKFVSVLSSVVPVYQPVLGMVGRGLGEVANANMDKPANEIKKIPTVYSEIIGQKEALKKIQADFAIVQEQMKGADSMEQVKIFIDFAKPIFAELKKHKGLLRNEEVPKDQVDAEILKLKQLDPMFKEVTEKLSELMAKKEIFNNKISATMDEMGSLSANLSSNYQQLSVLNTDQINSFQGLDGRAMIVVEKMKRGARRRLLKYHYNLAKAFEFRTLEKYQGDLNLVDIQDKFKSIIEQSTQAKLQKSDKDMIKAIYTEQLSSVAEQLNDIINDGNEKFTTSFKFKISQANLDNLNTKGSFKLNIDPEFFDMDQENIRINSIEITSFKTNFDQSLLGNRNYYSLSIEKGERSEFVSKGISHKFISNSRSWGATLDLFDNQFTTQAPSVSTTSLIRSLLGNRFSDDTLMMFSQTSALGEYKFTGRLNTDSDKLKVDVKEIMIKINYDFGKKSSSDD